MINEKYSSHAPFATSARSPSLEVVVPTATNPPSLVPSAPLKTSLPVPPKPAKFFSVADFVRGPDSAVVAVVVTLVVSSVVGSVVVSAVVGSVTGSVTGSVVVSAVVGSVTGSVTG